MDDRRFDALTRAVGPFPRRGLLAAVRVLVIGTLASTGPNSASARKRKKRPRPNAFGCLDLGKPCRNANRCCSGVCSGKKGKKRCKAHDASGCLAGQSTCDEVFVPCTTSAELPGACQTTTGNAGFCSAGGGCFGCTKDADCRPFCGRAAACIVCVSQCGAFGGTACARPDGDECVF